MPGLMFKVMAQLCLMALPLAAQQWTLGTAVDPCVGGTAFTIPSSGATVRYGDFACTFPVSDSGSVQVQLDFVEPCQKTGDCLTLVTKKGQRVQNTFVQDAPAVWNYDTFVAGMPGSSRIVLAWPINGILTVRVQTVTRAGVLAAVKIGPLDVNLTAKTCVGSGPGWDCAGIGLVGNYIIIPSSAAWPATKEATSLPACPASTACWQPNN